MTRTRGTYNNGHEGDINSSPAIAADGTIYFSFIQNLSGFGVVAAISQNPATPSQFTLKWTFVTGEFGTTSSPAIDTNGIIYLGFADGRLRAFQDNGSAAALKWTTRQQWCDRARTLEPAGGQCRDAAAQRAGN